MNGILAMPRGKQNEVTGALNALLRSRNECLIYDDDYKHKYDRILRMNLEGEEISIYIYRIYERAAKNNIRINIDKELLDEQKNFSGIKGNKSAFIGWFEDRDIFVAWDPLHAFSLNPSPNSGSSINAIQRLTKDTTKNRPSIYKANPQKISGHAFVIAMHSSMLTFYLKNMEELHSMNNEEDIISAMKGGTTNKEISSISSDEDLSEISTKYWAQQRKRDPKFRKSVLTAYNSACCVCGRQLGIVEAAHIIPANHKATSNSVKNGLALCVEHHVLYDKAILMPDHNYKLIFNKMKAKKLRDLGLDTGLPEIEDFNGKRIKLPKNEKMHPCKENLRKGIELRDPRILKP